MGRSLPSMWDSCTTPLGQSLAARLEEGPVDVPEALTLMLVAGRSNRRSVS